LLVASHIKPWAKDLKQAANPENGLCLNGLHDKAFDRGLLTLSEDFKVILSSKIMEYRNDENIKRHFLPYHNKKITLPKRFMPQQKFLEYHRTNIFTS
jgi:putative restriction endonuclease